MRANGQGDRQDAWCDVVFTGTAVDCGVPSMLNVTVPPGVLVTPAAGSTVTVNVTDWPAGAEGVEALSVTVSALPGFICCENVGEVLLVKLFAGSTYLATTVGADGQGTGAEDRVEACCRTRR